MATPYRKKYCDAVITHFSKMRKNEKGVIVGAPSFVSFAEECRVTLGTLERWRREYPEFDKACRDASEILRQLLMDASLSGEVNVSAAKFILASEFGMGSSYKSAEKKEGNEEDLGVFDRVLIQNLAKRMGLESLSL